MQKNDRIQITRFLFWATETLQMDRCFEFTGKSLFLVLCRSKSFFIMTEVFFCSWIIPFSNSAILSSCFCIRLPDSEPSWWWSLEYSDLFNSKELLSLCIVFIWWLNAYFVENWCLHFPQYMVWHSRERNWMWLNTTLSFTNNVNQQLTFYFYMNHASCDYSPPLNMLQHSGKKWNQNSC